MDKIEESKIGPMPLSAEKIMREKAHSVVIAQENNL